MAELRQKALKAVAEMPEKNLAALLHLIQKCSTVLKSKISNLGGLRIIIFVEVTFTFFNKFIVKFHSG